MEYKDMKLDDIINWCVKNKQVAWLKEVAATPIVTKDKKKNPILDENGMPKTHTPTFIEIKLAFVEKFMPELAPKREPKKPTMYEIIANL